MTVHHIEAHGWAYEIEADPAGRIGGVLATGVPYEAPLLEWIYDKQLTGTAIDVGAHVGNHTLWLAVVCQLNVLAYEPLTHDELRANLLLNEPYTMHVRSFPWALGAEIGHAVVVGQGKLAMLPQGETPASKPVPIVPLDEQRLPPDVVLIKIDVEDMEPHVLIGARATIERCRPIICAEARDDEAHAAIAELLEPIGYTQTAHFKRGTPLGCWECP